MRFKGRKQERSCLPKAGFISLLIHILLIVALGLSARHVITRVVPSVYRVALLPLGSGAEGIPAGGVVTPPQVAPAQEAPKGQMAEPLPASKMEQKERAATKVERATEAKSPAKQERTLFPKAGKPPDEKKSEKVVKEGGADQTLQEAIEEIHRKVAIEEIQRRVAEREGGGGASGAGPIVATGGGGRGPGTGWGGATPAQVYPAMIEAKIKREWSLPKNFPKAMEDLEAIIVIVIQRDGKVQRAWFEKSSGNPTYDQMAMRAIKKAEPLPPFPTGLSGDTYVIGIRFRPK